MEIVEKTLDTPAENLALDEALFLEAEESSETPEVLRIWESPIPFVVLGRSSRYATEVNVEYCQANSIPWLRRISGGGTVLAGPGCLMYGVVLKYHQREELRMLPAVHRFVMQKTQLAVANAGLEVSIEGISDLALGGRKVSGNALRCGRNAVLYHGTLVHDMNMDLLEKTLGVPCRMPDYRQARSHRQFVTRLGCESALLRRGLIEAWGATITRKEKLPMQRVRTLVAGKYSQAEWNCRH